MLINQLLQIYINIERIAPSENFTLYKFKNPEKMFIGINMSHFHKMVKAIKKKDSMVLFIDDERLVNIPIG